MPPCLARVKWERRIGDTFTLGTQVWRIRKITHNDVLVVPTEATPGIFPFWRAEDQNRDWHFSERILHFLETLNVRLGEPDLQATLTRDYHLDKTAAAELIAYLRRQKEATKKDLPHRHHVLIEHVAEPQCADKGDQVIIHTLWGGRINRPFSLALHAAWEEKFKEPLEIFQNNDCLLLELPRGVSAGEVLPLVTPENLERLLRQSLEKSGFFGAKFRENAGRALLLPRADFKRRLPLWLNRLRAKKLLETVQAYPDFPIVLETWRTCLQDEFDLANLERLLDEIRTGQIKLTETTSAAASPFADGLVWKQTNTYMYADDSPLSGTASRLSQDLIKEVLFSSRLRPRIPRTLVETLEGKLKRTAPGYAPRSADDLLDWVKERQFIPLPEWSTLLSAMDRDHHLPSEEVLPPIARKVVAVQLPGASVAAISAVENLARIAQAFKIPPLDLDRRDVVSGGPWSGRADRRVQRILHPTGHPETDDRDEAALPEIFLQWLSFYGPVRRSFPKKIMGLDETTLDEVLAGLAESEEIIVDTLSEDAAEPEICDRENLEILLRMARKSRQPSFRALGIDHLPLFLAAWQGLAAPGREEDDLRNRLDQLFGYPATADAWEKQILPARLLPYRAAWLEGLVQVSDLVWFGCGAKRMSFAFADDLELFTDRDKVPRGANETAEELARLLPGAIGRYNFMDIVRFSGMDSRAAAEALWDLAWRGLVTNDAMAVLRQGILTDFAPAAEKRGNGRPSRSAYNRWSATRPFAGNWYMIGNNGMERDPVAEAELVKDRVRQLFRRYGLLFRELLVHELPMLQWASIFKTLRIMELSGEILSGYFFEGPPGLQFISPEAFRFLNEPLPDESIYWMNATDPASLCGIGLEALKGLLPSRLPSTHLVYHGRRLVVISRRNGSRLEILSPPDAPYFPDYLAFFNVLLNREFSPEKIITVETINGRPALNSEYAGALKAFGFRGYYKGLELVKPY